MSKHNDSVLLTGMTSSSVSKVDRMKEKDLYKREAKLRKKAKISPTIEPVLEELDKERDATILAQLDLVDASTENFESQALALKLYKESMSKLKSRLTNIMRTKPE